MSGIDIEIHATLRLIERDVDKSFWIEIFLFHDFPNCFTRKDKECNCNYQNGLFPFFWGMKSETKYTDLCDEQKTEGYG